MVAEAKLVAFAERNVMPGRFGGSQDDAAGRLLDAGIAVGVVPVLVRVPHLADVPAAPLRLGERGFGLARVDDGGLARGGSWTSQM